jgi:hypothetical protein
MSKTLTAVWLISEEKFHLVRLRTLLLKYKFPKAYKPHATNKNLF